MLYKKTHKKLAIIGAGASGVVASISALQTIKINKADIDVHLFEINNKIAKPILKTGNGRCNFCNRNIKVENYWNSNFVKRVLEINSNIIDDSVLNGYECSNHSKLTLSFMKTLGLLWREESQGRLYPYANRASSILDVFNRELGHFDNFYFHPDVDRDSVSDEFQDIIVCTGKNAKILDALPVQHINTPTGVLCPIETQGKIVSKLDNIRAKVKVELIRDGEVLAIEYGEILFRKYGVSGICIFNLSRYAEAGDTLIVDFLPDFSIDEYDREIKPRLYNRDYKDDVGVALAGVVLPDVSRLAGSNLKNFKLTVKCLHESDGQAQTIRGGIDVSELDDTLKLINIADKNLYVAGEIIDVDGPCGGYNLNWATASGIIAGKGSVSNIINS